MQLSGEIAAIPQVSKRILIFIGIFALGYAAYYAFQNIASQKKKSASSVDPYAKYHAAIKNLASPLDVSNYALNIVSRSVDLRGWLFDELTFQTGSITNIRYRYEHGEIDAFLGLKNVIGNFTTRVEGDSFLLTSQADFKNREFPNVIYRLPALEYLLFIKASDVCHAQLTQQADQDYGNYAVKQFSLSMPQVIPVELVRCVNSFTYLPTTLNAIKIKADGLFYTVDMSVSIFGER